MKVKSATAVAEPVDLFVPPAESKQGTIPLIWSDCFQRVRYALLESGRTLVHSEASRRPGEEISYHCFEVEMMDGGKVRQVDLFSRAKELGQVESIEVPVGPGWPPT